FNPKIEEAVARLADAVAGESGYVDELARSYFTDVASTSPTTVSITRRDLLAGHPAFARRLIRLALEQARGSATDMEAVHLETLLDALHKPPGSYSLPAGFIATTDQRSLIIHRGPRPGPRRYSDRVRGRPDRLGRRSLHRRALRPHPHFQSGAAPRRDSKPHRGGR